MPTGNTTTTTRTFTGGNWQPPRLVDVPDLQAFMEDDEVDFDDREALPVKEIIKKRHLNMHERARVHKPASDWIETPAGEVCRSADTLMVQDILKKHGLLA